MNSILIRNSRRGGYALLALVTLMATVLSAAAAQAQATGLSVPEGTVAGITADKTDAVYVALLAADPVVAYEGDIQGLAATKPADGTKINPKSGKVKKYQGHLIAEQNAALRSVGVESADVVYNYTTSFNGVAATMTGSQALDLLKQDDVMFVWKDELRELTTDASDDYLNMVDAWDLVGGIDAAGEDIIIGVIDTGIDPENASFSDQLDLSDTPGNSGKRTESYGPVSSDWHGTCQSGELFSQDDCSNKIVGAMYFSDGFTNFEINFSGDPLSGRDWDGHGSHTASTAGGNVVDVVLSTGETVTMSGMAPRARIASYKACWADAGCAGSDLVAAIDQAVADGVDVINYSIGSSAATFSGPDDIAFLFAADAGIFVATSNGNDGPDPYTTGSPSSDPWLTSVGAVQHGRNFLGTVTTGDDVAHTGASLNDTVVEGVIVDSADAGSELCLPGELDSSVVSGNIVLCQRGVIARVDKSLAVQLAGGIGMVLYNPAPDSLNADTHLVPSVHVDESAGATIKAYIASEGANATATIGLGGTIGTIGRDVVAGFSSRGMGASNDIIKPDILAPGVNILAAVPGGAGFNSGTSMASPHIAGIGALIVQMHPDWSPAAIKSALMTTADPTDILKEDAATPATPLDQGSGLVQPGSSFDPGLVYDAGFLDYLAFLCGNSTLVGAGTCGFLAGEGYSFDGSDLNQPSIAIGELAGSQTVTRTVTNVGPAGTYESAAEAPAGVDVVVNPSTLTLAEGESASFEVTFTSLTDSVSDVWTFGSLTWTHGPHAVQSQLAIRPVVIAAPSELAGEGSEGSLSFDVTFGADGDYAALPHGLVAARETAGSVVDDPANDINVALGTGVGITVHEIVVPDGSAYARFSLMDDFTDGADDLDLYVFNSAGAFMGGSGSGTSAEQVDLVFPAGDTYLVIVHGWQTDGPDSNYTLFSWAFAGDEGNMTVTGPAAAVLGTTATIDVAWTGLDPDMFYLGAVSHNSGGEILGLTLINVDS